jgi:homopolymeric O-antigen transport system permease protein
MSVAPGQAKLPVYDSAALRHPVAEDLTQLRQRRDLLWRLIQRNITTRYRRSLLGVAWTMLNPLLTTVVMAIVFSQLFVSQIDHYAVYVLAGLVAWGFFAQTSAAIMSELIWGGGLLHRVYLPRTIFAFSALGTGLVNVGLAIVPLLGVMLVTGAPLTPALLALPVAVLVLAVFTLGLGLVLSTLAVQFGDVIDMYQILLTAWMYLTPVIYPIEIIPETYRWLLLLNPMYYFVELFRVPIQYGRLPDLSTALASLAIALVTLAGGLWFFLSKADDLVYRL